MVFTAVSKSSARDRLREWARAWIERFKPYTNFMKSLKITAEESPLYTNLFFETLGNDKALNCELMAISGSYAYLRCGKLFVKVATGLSSSTTRFLKEPNEVAKFFEEITEMLAGDYYYSSIDVIIYEGKEIEVKGLSETLGGTKISEVDVRGWWIIVRFEPGSRGYVTFTLEESGKISITWAGDIKKKKLENIAEQDLANHIQDLDKVLMDLYNVVKAGMKGIVNYVLY